MTAGGTTWNNEILLLKMDHRQVYMVHLIESYVGHMNVVGGAGETINDARCSPHHQLVPSPSPCRMSVLESGTQGLRTYTAGGVPNGIEAAHH